MSEHAEGVELLTSATLHIPCDSGLVLDAVVELEDEIAFACLF